MNSSLKNTNLSKARSAKNVTNAMVLKPKLRNGLKLSIYRVFHLMNKNY